MGRADSTSVKNTAAALTVLFGIACAPAPPPEVAAAPTSEDTPTIAEESEETEETTDAGDNDAGAEAAAPKPVYEEPPPVVVRRHHVYATMRFRQGKLVTVVSLLTTSETETVTEGTLATLQRKLDKPPDGGEPWVDVADVVVKTVKTKGSRVAGNERRELRLEIRAEHAEAKNKKRSPFRPKSKVRLQIDK